MTASQTGLWVRHSDLRLHPQCQCGVLHCTVPGPARGKPVVRRARLRVASRRRVRLVHAVELEDGVAVAAAVAARQTARHEAAAAHDGAVGPLAGLPRTRTHVARPRRRRLRRGVAQRSVHDLAEQRRACDGASLRAEVARRRAAVPRARRPRIHRALPRTQGHAQASPLATHCTRYHCHVNSPPPANTCVHMHAHAVSLSTARSYLIVVHGRAVEAEVERG